MSQLSPGSRATTNLFIILGVITLIALAVSVSRRQDSEDLLPAAICKDRFISMGPTVWDPDGPIIHPGETQAVNLTYTVNANGSIKNILITGATSDFDSVAINAAQKARYTANPNAEPLTCSYSMTLQLN
ncbi:MAG: hypothetical protein GY727_08490 [Gammaproteobacteria bacterium]|nr:hypothetical protein [Gammaproteobacteria bacterium]MCP4089056.1 hypothetical protein [Gammaproteobacteria bacterium]MCP4278044.1 hypothetical protein [Gammaproteobacteria bacterium]MCP4833020.1 hypothetical protein [Gammaproteobacteria bacterium]MCP4929261.1 hypothetical protein [Gammaproteobacteria bacterium]